MRGWKYPTHAGKYINAHVSACPVWPIRTALKRSGSTMRTVTVSSTPAFLSVPWGSDVRHSGAKYVPFVPALIFCPRLEESGETELVELHN